MVPLAGVTEKFSAARQKVTVALLCLAEASTWTLPVEVGGVGRGAEAGYLGVEADGDVEVVVTWKEEEGITLGAELVVLLNGVDAIDLGLHGGSGCGGREDGDVRAEVWGLGKGGGRRGRLETSRGRHGMNSIAWWIRICLGTSVCLVTQFSLQP